MHTTHMMSTTTGGGGGVMDGVVIGRFDAADAYPTTLPSPRMLEHSPREPSGFRKSLNPIYSYGRSGDHRITASPSSSTPTSSSEDTATESPEATDGDGAPVANTPPTVHARRRHTGGGGDDGRWVAIRAAESPLSLGHFRLLRRLGYGDIGSVYLVELRGSAGATFAMKVMDKGSLSGRNKLARAETEREILGMLDHPFLPTLYSSFETDKFCCLLMEYCCGGNLHSLRQRQPDRRFTEDAARFYASEVLLALEYLHMLGVVYRDLKPENVLVREGGHIMLSDFDLSLRCSVSPALVRSPSGRVSGAGVGGFVHGCKLPRILLPSKKKSKKKKAKDNATPDDDEPPVPVCSSNASKKKLPRTSQLEFTAEPTGARSTSFVGTHEYLAPEIVRGEGHGSAVDWWTLGVFLYELLHGATPFKGSGNRATLFNVVAQPLRFPDAPEASAAARDLIRGLLAKEPRQRLGYRRGATEVKQHPFFDGVNWALVRSAKPPYVPDRDAAATNLDGSATLVGGTAKSAGGRETGSRHTDSSSHADFECF